ncbi:MAG TPA: BatD family protein [Chitinophagaceae bacterium]
MVDVHTIRKLQLYPLEAGLFTIDPMELSNQVEFSQNEETQKSKQSVTENMYNNGSDTANANSTRVYETNIKSAPIVINVKPLPRKNFIDTFTGAVGNFSLNAFVEKDTVSKNEEDSMLIEINGDGNFQRVNAPQVTWPNVFEVFEPAVKDTFDKARVPLTGQRQFKFVFVSNKPGIYTIPPVSFSFFDLKSKTYKTISTRSFEIFVSEKNKPKSAADASSLIPTKAGGGLNWLLIAASALAVMAVVLLWIKDRQRKLKRQEQNKIIELPKDPVSVHELLIPAKSYITSDDVAFYDALDRSIWNYLNDRFSVSNTSMIKKELSNILHSRGVNRELSNGLVEIIHQCETGIYTKAVLNFDKTELLDKTREILLTIDKSIVTENG